MTNFHPQLLEKSGLRHEHSSFAGRRTRNAIRVGWIYRSSQPAPWHLAHFRSSGLQVQPITADQLLAEDMLVFDLIVLEAPDVEDGAQMRDTLVQLRNVTYAPILILTGHDSSEQTVELLRMGADRVQSLYTESSILLAHARASLRRCHHDTC